MGQTDNTQKGLRLLTSAEAFGYGPCSKLTYVVKKLKEESPNSRIEFLGEGSALDFALQNSSLFNGVHEYEGVYPNPDNYDAVLSVMNPFTILWGWFHRKKCIYIDSLYWFWKFDEKNFNFLEDVINQLTNAESIEEVWALTKDVPVHHLHYIAHKLSTISCNQFFGNESQKLDIFRRQIKNIVTVNPMVDTSYKHEVKRDTVLITLGGLLSPLNQKKEALAYVNLVLKITDEFILEASKNYKVVLASNPEIVKAIKDIPRDVIVTSLSQEEMLKTINRSVLVLTTAGITTMYECLEYETPFFVLPELHDGNYSNYLRLAGGKKDKLDKISSIFPNSLMSSETSNKSSLDPDSEIKRIQSVIKRLNATGSFVLRDLREKVNMLVPLLSNNIKIREMAHNQRDFVLKDGSNKHQDVCKIIKRTLDTTILPDVRKRHLIGIISSALEIRDKKDIIYFKNFGEKFAEHNINVATGASIGIAHIIGTTAKRMGSKLIGFSPDNDALLHSKRSDNASVNDFDSIHFNGKGFTARSLEFIKSVDALIMISGRMGTLSEFTIGFEEGVPIFVLKGYGGVSDQIERIIEYSNKDGLIPPTTTTNTKDLMNSLLYTLDSRYYR